MTSDKSDKPIIKNQLYIIGNGFDLAHGLETSYDHFMFDYYKEQLITCCNNKKLNQKSHKYLYDDDLFDFSVSKSNSDILLTNINKQTVKHINHKELLNLFQIKPKTNFAKNLYSSQKELFSNIDINYETLELIITGEVKDK